MDRVFHAVALLAAADALASGIEQILDRVVHSSGTRGFGTVTECQPWNEVSG